MTLANRLTLLRVALAGAVFAALLSDSLAWHGAALLMFIIAMITDWLDGWIARQMRTVSSFGKVADPIADKILIIGTFVALQRMHYFQIPPWAVFIIIMRELIIGGIRVIASTQGQIIAADQWGKIKTVIQLISVLVLVLIVFIRDLGYSAPWLPRCAYPLTILCAVLAVSSLWAYLRQYRALLEKSWS